MSDPEYKSLPFGVEYAKSSRASCKGCKNLIGQDSLRMSVREPSRFFDGMQDNWFHFTCFWKKIKPGKVEINERSIRGVDLIKWDDQERIREKIRTFVKTAPQECITEIPFSTLKVEYAKTSRSKCFLCKHTIPQKEIKFGKGTSWYHQKCLCNDVMFEGDVNDIGGFSYLTEDDQHTLVRLFNSFVKKTICAEDSKENLKRFNSDEMVFNEEILSKRSRKDTGESNCYTQLKEQADMMCLLRKDFKDNLSKNEMVELLATNKLDVPSGETKIIELLVDCALFGCCLPCPKCKGQLNYSSTMRTYRCNGQLSEYTKCIYQNNNPERRKFVISKGLRKNQFLKKLKINVFSKRAYNDAVSNEIIVSHSDAFKYLGSRCMNATAKDDIEGKSVGVSSGLSRQIVKCGSVIDQECEYSEFSHVYRDSNGMVYSVVLGNVDMLTNKNSYYKLQLLKHDHKPIFYIFRSWGRVGTTVGGSKTEVYRDLSEAVDMFTRIFMEKSGNLWSEKQNFKKLPGYMDMVETDISDLGHVNDCRITPGSQTNLHPAIRDVILMIFDLEQMKSTMLGFQLDLDKMPLGRLSKKQITNAYSILTELQTIISAKPDTDEILDASNRFYTLIPHNFGMEKPPLLNSLDLIKEKCNMLGSLMEIQVAYEVIRDDKEHQDDDRDPVDIHYEKLMCKMEVVDPESSEFETVKYYMTNTHGATHTLFDLDVINVIRVDRAGEKEKFKCEIGNRRLLWHGSSTANYGGILSQGLRIAPPEAPVTGYMFGKGVYFADMASKSANYCRVHSDNEDGLLLLCDVALGKVKEELHAVNHSPKTIKGFNSVQGIGKTEPDPQSTIVSEEGYSIPLGKPVAVERGQDSSLLYNEYIVFDVDQIKINYLVRTKFKMNF